MAFDPLTDAIIVFSLNVALIAGCFWVLLRFVEQCTKVWQLFEEKKRMRAIVRLVKRMAWLHHLKNRGEDVEKALEEAYAQLDEFRIKEEK